MPGSNCTTGPVVFGVRESSQGVFDFHTGLPDFIFDSIAEYHSGSVPRTLMAVLSLYDSLGVHYVPMDPLYASEASGCVIYSVSQLRSLEVL